jgi:hypothetical protein
MEHLEFADKFRAFRDLLPVLKKNAPLNQTPQTGIKCGLPVESAVDRK